MPGVRDVAGRRGGLAVPPAGAAVPAVPMRPSRRAHALSAAVASGKAGVKMNVLRVEMNVTLVSA